MAENIEILFGRAVRRYREKLGLSQEVFADVAGIHRTYVSSIERGKVQVSIGIANQLALALQVPMSRIWRDIEKVTAATDYDDESPEGHVPTAG